MAEYTKQELREQAEKAGRYFGRGLAENGKDWIGIKFDDGTLILVTRSPLSERVERALEGGKLLGDGKIEQPNS